MYLFALVTTSDPAPSLNSFMSLGLNVADFILGIVGALTLLMFVYGGIIWIISGGSSDKIKQGKDIILGSIIGLMIVFSSYLIIQFVTVNLLGSEFKDTLPTDQTPPTNTAGQQCRTIAKGECAATCTATQIDKKRLDCPTTQTCCAKISLPPQF